MSDYQFVITNSEARALLALSDDDGATLSELAAGIRLPPSQVQDIVSHLSDKMLARFNPETQHVELLEAGRRASAELARQQIRRAVQKRGFQSVVVVPDEITPSDLPGLADLDSAINDELSKLL